MTQNVDTSTQNVDTMTQNVDTSTQKVDAWTHNIDTSIHNARLTFDVGPKQVITDDMHVWHKTFRGMDAST